MTRYESFVAAKLSSFSVRWAKRETNTKSQVRSDLEDNEGGDQPNPIQCTMELQHRDFTLYYLLIASSCGGGIAIHLFNLDYS